MNAQYIISTLAQQADARFTETVAARTGRTRWTMTASDLRIPEVQVAYRAKVTADAVWLAWLRHHGPEVTR